MLQPAMLQEIALVSVGALFFSFVAGRIVQGAWKRSVRWEVIASLAVLAIAFAIYSDVPRSLPLWSHIALGSAWACISPVVSRGLVHVGLIGRISP